MSDQPQFTNGWKTVIVLALVASFRSCIHPSHQVELTNLRYEKRMDALEKSVQKIETFLYESVATSENKDREKISKIESYLYDHVAGSESKTQQRMDEIEKSVKSIKEHLPAPEAPK